MALAFCLLESENWTSLTDFNFQLNYRYFRWTLLFLFWLPFHFWYIYISVFCALVTYFAGHYFWLLFLALFVYSRIIPVIDVFVSPLFLVIVLCEFPDPFSYNCFGREIVYFHNKITIFRYYSKNLSKTEKPEILTKISPKRKLISKNCYIIVSKNLDKNKTFSISGQILKNFSNFRSPKYFFLTLLKSPPKNQVPSKLNVKFF